SQTSQSAQTPNPVASEPAPAVAAPGVNPTPADGQAAPEQTPDSELDKFLKETADKIDAIPYVSAEIIQTIRLADRQIRSTGVYKKGPDYQLRFELDVEMGDATGKRINVSDGKVAYKYEKVTDVESLQTYDLASL